MATIISYFPFGTTRGTVFSYCLALFYGFFSSIDAIIRIIINRSDYFNVKARPEKPECLTDYKFGKHSFIELKNGLKLHYVSNGDPKNQMILFLHGFPECWYSWRNQLTELSDNYFTVAIDMRGFGESDKPEAVSEYSLYKLVNDIKEVIESFGREKCVVIGHDWGGIVALTTAAAYPQMVDKLIVMNAPNSKEWMTCMQTDWKQFFMSWYVFFFNLPLLPEITIKSFDLKAIEDLFKPFTTEADIEAYKYYYSRDGALSGPINYYRAYLRQIDVQYINVIQQNRIKSPTLMIWGLKDHALSAQLAENSCKMCDNYTIKYIDDCSHWTQVDKPFLVNEYIKQFLK